MLKGHGEMDMLEFHENWPVPQYGDSEVLIKVGACGLNNTDVNTRTAWYAKGVSDATTGGGFDTADDEDSSWSGAAITFPRIQGADAVGTVVAAGAHVPTSILGQRVLIDTWLRASANESDIPAFGYFGSESDGGFAEYAKVAHHQVHPIVCNLTDVELATFATAYVTAENMLNRANAKGGDTVLIPGASGGVGSALIQLANRRGALTIAMCGADKTDLVGRSGQPSSCRVIQTISPTLSTTPLVSQPSRLLQTSSVGQLSRRSLTCWSAVAVTPVPAPSLALLSSST